MILSNEQNDQRMVLKNWQINFIQYIPKTTSTAAVDPLHLKVKVAE